MKVLIVVDMQVDFTVGALANKAAEDIAPAIAKYAKNFDGTVIFTHDTHGEDYLQTNEGKHLPVAHCIKGTDGWRILPVLEDVIHDRECVGYEDKYLIKPTFGYLDWKKHLPADLESIELCGTCTDICVISNALILKAAYPEIPVSVHEDMCAGVTPELHKAAIDVMRSCQVEIITEASHD